MYSYYRGIKLLLKFYQVNSTNKVYSPSDITNIMELYNKIGIGCVSCDQKFTDWQIQDVFDSAIKSKSDVVDALLVEDNNNNPHFVLLKCENPQCKCLTSISEPNAKLKDAIENCEIVVIQTDGLHYPLYAINYSMILDIIDGNYMQLIMRGNWLMLINDLIPKNLPPNPHATKIYTSSGYYKNKKIRGNTILITVNEMNKLKAKHQTNSN